MNKSDNNERWGGFTDGSDLKSELQASDFISPKQKLEKLKMSNVTTTTSNENNPVLVNSIIAYTLSEVFIHFTFHSFYVA